MPEESNMWKISFCHFHISCEKFQCINERWTIQQRAE